MKKRGYRMGIERDEVPSRVQGRARRVKGSALAYPGRSPETRLRFSAQRAERAQNLAKDPPEWVSKGTKSLRGSRAEPAGSRAAPLWVWAKPRNPQASFAEGERAQSLTKDPPEWVSKGTKSLRGCRAEPAGSRAAPLRTPGEARKPTRNFRQRRKSATNQHNNASPSAHPPCAFGYGMKITCLGEEIPLLQFHFYAIMHLSYARLLPCLRKELN